MRNYFLNLGFIVLALFSVSADAEIVDKDTIPPQIMDQFYKKHPDALDITAEQKKHFGQDLYEINFKEGEEKLIELYRPNGHFYVSAVYVEADGLMPAAGNDNLKAAFTSYEIKDAILIANPNGTGEEYDLTVNASGNDWSVLIDGKGNIINKERD